MDEKMANARHELDWEKQLNQAIDPERAIRIHSRCKDVETCSMCGELCSIKIMKDVLDKK
jgi:phosphomethylpyrimidine synthase